MDQSAQNEKTLFGFWTYLMTDCVLFASLFAAYAVLHGSTFTGPTGSAIFDLPHALVETLILLTSSFTCGLAELAAKRGSKNGAILWLVVTCVLGAAFLGIELSEFAGLAASGYTWQTSAFLSSFFTLVGTHGLHIAAGLLWIAVMIGQIIKKGLTAGVERRLALFGLFWHFLDFIWIFIFTIVYLFGALHI